jgi:hypothetical protein
MPNELGERILCGSCEYGYHNECKEDWIEYGVAPLYVGRRVDCECIEGPCLTRRLQHQAKDASYDVSARVYEQLR